jgi:GTPase involved in cell partitioning and DNA repair
LLRRWLRHVESLREIEEVVHICEPKVEKNPSDEEEKISKDLMNYQEGSDENSYCLVGNEMRSIEDIIGFEE